MKWKQCGANLRAFSLSRHRALHFLIPVKEALIHLSMRALLLAEYAHDPVCKRLDEKGQRRTLFCLDENLDGHSRLRFIETQQDVSLLRLVAVFDHDLRENASISVLSDFDLIGNDCLSIGDDAGIKHLGLH